MSRQLLRDRHGRPVYPIGVNYWPRHTAVEMWTRWDPQGIAQDLREMRALGLNTVRFFLRTADFADAEANLRPEALEKLDAFLALCREHDLYTLPSFFVGHMSGTNFPIPWERGRDFYTDPEVLARSRRFVQAIVARYRDEDAILGWLLSNEITHHTGKREAHVLLGWMRSLYNAIRRVDPRRPIAPGDGADFLRGGPGYPEGALADIEEMSQGQDFVSLHHYYDDTDALRFSHAPAGMVRLCDIGQPVLVEEFGVSTALWAESAQADYFRLVLFSTWAAGAAGALAWCWSDFPTADLPPYTHHPHELFFGITRADGSEKPAAGEMRRFARLMAQVDATRWAPAAPQAAILVPTTFYVNYPFRSVDRPRLLKTLLEAYALARMAGFDVVFVREPALPLEDVRLLLAPLADLLSPTWYNLQAWVEAGGVLWAGFGGAVPNLEELFGVHPERPGRVGAQHAAPLRLVEPFGELTAGEVIALPAAEAPCLPIVPTETRVLAVDEEDRPALTVHSVGRGKAFFCPRSLEWLLTSGAEVHRWSPAHRLYRALRSEAGIVPPFDTSQPALSLSILEGQAVSVDRRARNPSPYEEEAGRGWALRPGTNGVERNPGDFTMKVPPSPGPSLRGRRNVLPGRLCRTRLLVAINHSDAPLEEVAVCCQRPPRRVVDMESGEELEVREGTFQLSLEPWDVRVLEVGE